MRRTPYFGLRLQDEFKVYFEGLKNHLLEQGFSNENFNNDLGNYQGITKNLSWHQVVVVSDYLDELTDSFIHNTIVVQDGTSFPDINLACVSVSLLNMRLSIKGMNQLEMPKITYINLGMNVSEFNKQIFFYKHQADKNQPELYSNLQYISMFHRWNKSTENENAWKPLNSIEIALNEYLENQNTNMDQFFSNNSKCPKTIGSNEFIWLFDQIIKLVRVHKPNVVMFTYDFSMTRAHNHPYDLKTDVLGYFLQMLSLVSNQHVLFLANTNQANHIYSETQNIPSFSSFDLMESLSNSASNAKINKLISDEGSYEMSSSKQENKDSYLSDEECAEKQNKIADQSTDLSEQTDASYSSDQLPQIRIQKSYDIPKDKMSMEDKAMMLIKQNTIIPKGKEKKDTTFLKDLIFLKDKFNVTRSTETRKVPLLTPFQQQINRLVSSPQFFKSIQDQFYAVTMGLLERVNYRKLISLYLRKAYHNIEPSFQQSVLQQMNFSSQPHQAENYWKEQNNNNTNIQQSQSASQPTKHQLTQLKINQYIIKIKQSKHISDFIIYSNEQKFNILKDPNLISFDKSTLDSKNPEPAIINLEEDHKTILDDEVDKQSTQALFTKELRIKLMLKKYTQALINNWVFDLRRNEKVFLNAESATINNSVDNSYCFFFTERSQYIIDYEYKDEKNEARLVIYFFNVQRGSVFKNFVLKELLKNTFEIHEIEHEMKQIPDFLWKSCKLLAQVPEDKDKDNQGTGKQVDGNGEVVRKQQAVDSSTQSNSDDTNKNEYFIYQEETEQLEFFNSTLCLSSKYVYRLFGEILNPRTWKQKELSILVFCLPRLKQNQVLKQQYQMRILNGDSKYGFHFSKSIPRSGCSAVSYLPGKEEKGIEAEVTNELVIVFGGVSHNGYIYNTIEEYPITLSGDLAAPTKTPKQLSYQATFRPLIQPISFIIDNCVYFVGGEFGNALMQRCFKQIYVQMYSIEGKSYYSTQLQLSDLEIKLELLFDPKQKTHQSLFLKHLKKFSFSTCNINQFVDKDSFFNCSIIGKVNAGIEQVLEKSTVIKINTKELASNVARNDRNHNLECQFECVTTIEKESRQSFLKDYNSSTAFFISVFGQSSFGPARSQQEAKQQVSEESKSSNQEAKPQLKDNSNSSSNTNGNIQNNEAILQQQKQLQQQQEQQKVLKQQQQLQQQLQQQSQQPQEQPVEKIITKRQQQQQQATQQISQEQSENVKKHEGVAPIFEIPQPFKCNYMSLDQDKFLPMYFLTQSRDYKLTWILQPNELKREMEKFLEFNLRTLDPDYQNFLLQNTPNYFTSTINFQKKILIFYKTFSFEEAQDFQHNNLSDLSFLSQVFKSTIKLDQKKLKDLLIQPLSDDLELVYPNLLNRYVVSDLKHVYLINGADISKKEEAFYKEAPCERISLQEGNVSEKIDPCIFLNSKTSILLSNDQFIFYIGIHVGGSDMEDEDQEGGENDSQDDEDDFGDILIAQIFIKEHMKWIKIQIKQKEILKGFEHYSFVLGPWQNSIAAVLTKASKKSKDKIAITMMNFDVQEKAVNLQQFMVPFNWNGGTKIQVASAPFNLNTIFVCNSPLATQFVPISMIPPQQN